MFHVVLRRSGPQWDPSRPMEEQSDWAAHASFMDGLVDEGFIVLGGPLADEHRVVHVVEAESGRVGTNERAVARYLGDGQAPSSTLVAAAPAWRSVAPAGEAA